MVDGVLQMLIEVKAIGIDLKTHHVDQAVDYGLKEPLDWIILTNGVTWRVYRIIFGRPVDQELVAEMDFCDLDHKSGDDIDRLFLLCKEGWAHSALTDYYTRKQALSRFFIGATILTEPVLKVIRHELHLVSPDVKIPIDEIKAVLVNDVIKRDVLEGDKADHAHKKINKKLHAAQKESKPDESTPAPCSPAAKTTAAS
jgi:hypothetical protein